MKTPQNLNRLPKVEERQLSLCMLGLLSDKTVYPQVMEIFLEAADGHLRSLAARALGEIKNKAAIPALKRALKDDFQVTYPTDVRFSPDHPYRRTIYPVRYGGFFIGLTHF